MNKTELVAAIAERTELTKKEADNALKAFIDVVGDELSKGERFSWQALAHLKLQSAQNVRVSTREPKRPSPSLLPSLRSSKL